MSNVDRFEIHMYSSQFTRLYRIFRNNVVDLTEKIDVTYFLVVSHSKTHRPLTEKLITQKIRECVASQLPNS